MRRTDKNNIKEKSRIVIVKEKVKCVRGRPVNRMIKAAAKFKGLDKAKRYEDDKTPADDAESCAAEIARAAFYFEPQRRTGTSRSISKLHQNSAAQQKMRQKTAADKARQACKPNELTADNCVQQKIKTDDTQFQQHAVKTKESSLPERITQSLKKAPDSKQRREYVRRKSIILVREKSARAEKIFVQHFGAALSKSTIGTVGSATLYAAVSAMVASICVLILIAGIAASPFGILFANEPQDDGAIQLNAAVARINAEFAARLDEVQDGEFEEVIVDGEAPDWREVVAIFACKLAGADDGIDVATMDEQRVAILRSVFWDMVDLNYAVEAVERVDDSPDNIGGIITEKILKVTISCKTADDMRRIYGFSDMQNKALDEMLSDRRMLNELIADLRISQADAVELLSRLPDELDENRYMVVKTALTLVGKVNYFWGGKSLALGWDYRWGVTTKVTAEGSQTTGTYRPYGLDCSGFVDWAFYNATNGQYYPSEGNGGTYAQRRNCYVISEADALPGDLVFAADIGHVGIVGGRDDNGNLLIIHCTSGTYNNVVITEMTGFFSIVARPRWY